jgi:hypothetical protein
MDNAIWLANIFGPFLVIIGLWTLLYLDNHTKVCTSVRNTPGLFYMMGMINLLIGLVIISMYNRWNWNLAILVTLLGWVTAIRGVLIFFAPQLMIKAGQRRNSCITFGVVRLVVGILLCWLAFAYYS